MDNAILVFGSKVLEGGIPSGSLRRRTLGALSHSRLLTGSVTFVVSGGVGTHPPSEAAVMRDLLLEAGVDDTQIILDEDASDTMDSILNMKSFFERYSARQVYVCSDDYHTLRCALVYRLLWGHCKGVYVHGVRNAAGMIRWTYYCLREAIAIPLDLLIACRHRFFDR